MINENTPLETKVIGIKSHCGNSRMVGIVGRIISKTYVESKLSAITIEFEKDINGHNGEEPIKYLNIQTIGRLGSYGRCWCYNSNDFHKLRILSSDSEVEE
jgi:hypothetical protein